MDGWMNRWCKGRKKEREEGRKEERRRRKKVTGAMKCHSEFSIKINKSCTT
jgi:hypothetical protein